MEKKVKKESKKRFINEFYNKIKLNAIISRLNKVKVTQTNEQIQKNPQKRGF